MQNKKQRRAEAKGKKAAATAAENKTAAPAATAATAKTPKAEKVAKEGALPKLPRIPAANRPHKAKAKKPCICGCGTPTTGQWAPGHDARAKGWAIRIERDICSIKDVPENEQAGAKFMLKVRKDLAAAGAGTKSNMTVVRGGKIKPGKGDSGNRVAPSQAETAEAVEGAPEQSSEQVSEQATTEPAVNE